MNYAEAYSKLCYETAIITFLKKDGTVRIMLGTRNLNTVSILYGFQGKTLGGHDNRCNINNGNLAVFDMVIGDARSFNINRLVDITFCGVITSKEQYDEMFNTYLKYKEEYEKTNPMSINFDSISTDTSGTGGN